MGIITALISVSAIAAGTALLRRAGLRLCPLCVGVSATWLWLLVVRTGNTAVDPAVLGLLMGGTVVGLAYQLQKRLPADRSPALFLALFAIAGFGTANGAIAGHWSWTILSAAGLVGVMGWAFLAGTHPERKDSAAVADVEKKLENCCS